MKTIRWINAGLIGYASCLVIATLLVLIVPDAVVGRAARLTVTYDLPSMIFPVLVALILILPFAVFIARKWFLWTKDRSTGFNVGALVFLAGINFGWVAFAVKAG